MGVVYKVTATVGKGTHAKEHPASSSPLFHSSIVECPETKEVACHNVVEDVKRKFGMWGWMPVGEAMTKIIIMVAAAAVG